MKSGKIIAVFGIPGSGKSTLTKSLGEILKIPTFHEPEEENWGEAVSMRNVVGNFTSLMWFRAIRIPMLYKAKQLRENGKTSILDSYYDKLFFLYMKEKGIEWLFDKSDKFYEEMLSIAKKDYESLPNADILMFLKLNETTWKKFIRRRNRFLDNDEEFKKSFKLQKAFEKAIHLYSIEKKCRVIIHEQEDSSPYKTAIEISKKLKNL